jgi:hypothetical protein
MPSPARVVEHGPRESDQVCFAAGDDLVNLPGACNKADGDGGDIRAVLDAVGERKLVAGPDRDPCNGEAPLRDFEPLRSCTAAIGLMSSGENGYRKSSRSARASLRSAVSNPSVKRSYTRASICRA